MNNYLPLVFICAAFLTALGCDSQVQDSQRLDGQTAAHDVKFKSVFWAANDSGDGEVIKPIRDRIDLNSRTALGWTVELDEPVYLYLIYRDPSDDVRVLFPGQGSRAPHRGVFNLMATGTTLDDEVGVDRFYLIASATAIEPLDSRIKALWSATAENRAVEEKRLLEAVLDLQREYEDLTDEAARPVPIGGSVRSYQYALEYTANRVFFRTFTIDHR